MTREEIGDEISRYINENFLFGDRRVEPTESLIGSGVVDSTGILEIITFLENRFQVSFDDAELVADNFNTVEHMVSFVLSKLTPPSSR